MKKIFLLLLISLFSLNLFSEEFSLFPWFCTKKDVYTQCINKGWNYMGDDSDKLPYYLFYTTGDVTYHGFPVFAVHFLFNENGDLVTQSVTFPREFASKDTFPNILELILADKAQLLEKSYDTDDNYNTITYKGMINNKINVHYNIRGKDNLYQISVYYVNY